MIEQLQHITQAIGSRFSPLEQIELVGRAGVKWTQLRLKETDDEVFLEIAQRARTLTTQLGMRLIINDHVDIALKCRADGVHLGQDDLSTTEARRILGKHAIIGKTCNTRAHIEEALNEPIDYIGLGPYRHTSTKKTLSPLLGIDGYARLVPVAQHIPVIAIGGITAVDIKSLQEVGVHGVAVAAEINASENIEASCHHFLHALNT